MTNKTPGKTSIKYIISALVIVAVIVTLIIVATKAGAKYFLTVDELLQQGNAAVNTQVKVSGAVIGSSIQYDPAAFELNFKIANLSGDLKAIDAEGGLAAALHNAVIDPNRDQLRIIYHGIKPDLLKDEVQAILTGSLNPDGTFTATEILLKCPSKYAEQLPEQVEK